MFTLEMIIYLMRKINFENHQTYIIFVSIWTNNTQCPNCFINIHLLVYQYLFMFVFLWWWWSIPKLIQLNVWILPKNDSFNIPFNIALPKIQFKYYSIPKKSSDSIQKIIRFNSQEIIYTGRMGKVPKNCPKSVQNNRKWGLFNFHQKLQI